MTRGPASLAIRSMRRRLEVRMARGAGEGARRTSQLRSRRMKDREDADFSRAESRVRGRRRGVRVGRWRRMKNRMVERMMEVRWMRMLNRRRARPGRVSIEVPMRGARRIVKRERERA